MELALGDRGRSGGQYDIWQAVFRPVGSDGYPEPIFDKMTGAIDRSVAAYWRENYDLTHIIERDWATLAPKLQGKIHHLCRQRRQLLPDRCGLFRAGAPRAAASRRTGRNGGLR